MIKQVFLTFIAISIIYSGFIFFISKKKKEYFIPQNMWQENMIRMQKYVYQEQSCKYVLLGSSLTGRLKLNKDSTPDYYSLAAGGGDPFIGLEIIKRTGQRPKRIYIETNFLLTKGVHDKTYLNSLYLPVFYDLRKVAPFLREQNQPLNFLGYAFMRIASKAILSEDNNTAVNKTENIDNLLRKRVFRNDYNNSIFANDKRTIEINQINLQDYLDYYKKHGVSICFYEMPRDCEVENILTAYSRRKINEIAKINNIDEIALPPCGDYTTSDGLHLTDNSAIIYTKYFFNQIKLKF